MSSLTSIGINKNKKGFAPKITKRRANDHGSDQANKKRNVAAAAPTTDNNKSDATLESSASANISTATTDSNTTTATTNTNTTTATTPPIDSPAITKPKNSITVSSNKSSASIITPSAPATSSIYDTSSDAPPPITVQFGRPATLKNPPPSAASKAGPPSISTSSKSGPPSIGTSSKSGPPSIGTSSKSGPPAIGKSSKAGPPAIAKSSKSGPPTISSSKKTTEKTSKVNKKKPEKPTRAVTPDLVQAKSETLTEEELAINNMASNRRKRRLASQNNDGPSTSGPGVDEPAGVAIFIDRPSCDMEPRQGTVLKIEATTPDSRALDTTDEESDSEEEEETEADFDEDVPVENNDDEQFNEYEVEPVRKVKRKTTTKRVRKPRANRKEKKEKKEKAIVVKAPNKYAYREVENLITLDDITGDPAKIENLEMPMSAFTKDVEGVVSKVFKEMEVARDKAKKKSEATSKMSAEELEEYKRKEEEEEKLAAEKKERLEAIEAEKRQKENNNVLQESSNTVQVRIVNGEIVLDTDTLVVERQGASSGPIDDTMEVVEENSLSRKVNSHTYGKKKPSSRWTPIETAMFYENLSQFGTDFEMLSKLMPGRTRNQIRLKFNREEKCNPEKVTEYLITKRKPMDLEKFKEIAGIDLETVPDDFNELTLL